NRPLALAGKVALPHRRRVAIQEVGPSIRMIVRLWTEPCLDEHVLHRLPRDLVPEPPHRLHDLGVAPAGLLPDPDDSLTDALLDARAAGFGVRRLGPLVWRVLDAPHPLAEGRVADDRNQLLDAAAQLLPVPYQPT